MVASASRHHIRKVFNQVRNGIRRKAMKKSVKKVKPRGMTLNALLKRLTRETIINAARMEDFDAAMNRQLTVWGQESGAGMIRDNK
ncbi:hypothetical protein AAVH_35138 [Aphelenchoides avenae]|nr:hypothetical protein AAVH_35138 [Aphelenchus avenae]